MKQKTTALCFTIMLFASCVFAKKHQYKKRFTSNKKTVLKQPTQRVHTDLKKNSIRPTTEEYQAQKSVSKRLTQAKVEKPRFTIHV